MSGVAFPELPHRHHIVESRFACRGSRFMCGKHEHDDHDDHSGTDEQRAVPPASGADQRQQTDHESDQPGVEDDRIEQASQDTAREHNEDQRNHRGGSLHPENRSLCRERAEYTGDDHAGQKKQLRRKSGEETPE
jgi:hypothetical protein